MRLEWLTQALNDFEEIVDYIAEDNPVAAIEQGDEIETQVAGLLANHHQGRPGRVKGTRELVIVRTPYIAAYALKKVPSRFSRFSTEPVSGPIHSDRSRQNRVIWPLPSSLSFFSFRLT